MAGKTQLRGAGHPTRRPGSFAGKEATANPAGPHNPGTITQLRCAGIPMRRYGSFAGKEQTDAPTGPPKFEGFRRNVGRMLR